MKDKYIFLTRNNNDLDHLTAILYKDFIKYDGVINGNRLCCNSFDSENISSHNLISSLYFKFYNENLTVKIIDDSLQVLDSNWSESINLKEGDTTELFVENNKPIKDISDIVLYKDKSKITPNDHIKLSVENLKDNNGNDHSKIVLTISESIPSDSGKYKLAIADSTNKKKPFWILIFKRILFIII